MYQGTMGGLLIHSENCQIRKVVSLLRETLRQALRERPNRVGRACGVALWTTETVLNCTLGPILASPHCLNPRIEGCSHPISDSLMAKFAECPTTELQAL
jgi:hypothetical protein